MSRTIVYHSSYRSYGWGGGWGYQPSFFGPCYYPSIWSPMHPLGFLIWHDLLTPDHVTQPGAVVNNYYGPLVNTNAVESATR